MRSVFALIRAGNAVMPAEIVLIDKTPEKSNAQRQKTKPTMHPAAAAGRCAKGSDRRTCTAQCVAYNMPAVAPLRVKNSIWYSTHSATYTAPASTTAVNPVGK